tara:strand:- start:1888 stop:2457 length:570 start_codon:yes stop_codon:yes gene_type:complete
MKKTIVNKYKKKSRTQNQSGGRKRRKSLKKKKTNKRKWSMKYKKSINCKKPKGFSQKQYCKFGRKKKGGVKNWREIIINSSYDKLKTIIGKLNTIDTENNSITKTTKFGYMALIKYNQLNPLDDIYKGFKTQALNLINESRTGTPIVGVDYDIEDFYGQFQPIPPPPTPPPPMPPLYRQPAIDYTIIDQ